MVVLLLTSLRALTNDQQGRVKQPCRLNVSTDANNEDGPTIANAPTSITSEKVPDASRDVTARLFKNAPAAWTGLATQVAMGQTAGCLEGTASADW